MVDEPTHGLRAAEREPQAIIETQMNRRQFDVGVTGHAVMRRYDFQHIIAAIVGNGGRRDADRGQRELPAAVQQYRGVIGAARCRGKIRFAVGSARNARPVRGSRLGPRGSRRSRQ